MLLFFYFITGLVVLTFSADKFVDGAAITAKNLGMSPILVGLTIVALGTSAPEIIVSIIAALDGAGALAVGNALGSNLANIGLVLGVTLLITKLNVRSTLLKQEIPVLIIVMILAGVCLYDLTIDVWDSVLLLATLVIILVLLVIKERSGGSEESLISAEALPSGEQRLSVGLFWLAFGLILLLASSRLLVYAATEIAIMFGISELIIGLTIVAVGTSLPELAASVASALKGMHDIALGNVLGSNILNILAVMSIPGLIGSTTLEASVLTRDYLIMMILTVLLVSGMLIRRKGGALGLKMGIGFLAIYAGYYVILYQAVAT